MLLKPCSGPLLRRGVLITGQWWWSAAFQYSLGERLNNSLTHCYFCLYHISISDLGVSMRCARPDQTTVTVTLHYLASGGVTLRWYVR